jgi:hypothetical protein
MKRDGAERVMQQLKGKSAQEQLEYWQKGTEELRKHQQALRKRRSHSQ